ncbi:ISAs1 family transposase [Humisphaera borealis]|uniref:ISAs1 family transposase n=2 Tax=Humisphaera borealis TaxID=2807512 RepID=A0A7M2WV34_9BACT|nr:ISAs1 family transposase [Humisphaera borealis]QOV89417.1 ISAs1 family transposase [Humisphaera borealis]
MDGPATSGTLRAFSNLPDPRGCNVIHKLHDILVISVCAVICGADGWVDVELYGKSKLSWLRTFLDLPHGIPSHDTFGRVFAKLHPDAFEQCFNAWVGAIAQSAGGRLIAIDGKAIRRSFEHAWARNNMTHMVSAFVDAHRMVFGQVAVDDKSNEIEAIPRLLGLLDIQDATVTIDAAGCQTQIARQIVDAGGNYVLSVKENQPTLHAKVRKLLDEAILGGMKDVSHGVHEEFDADHGRLDTRKVWVMDEVHWLGDLCQQWPGLAGVIAVERKREVLAGKSSVERHYFISSVAGTDARAMAAAIRGHWAIENKLHWQLDVSSREDERRIRKGYGAENYSRLCRLTLNLLKRDRSIKNGIHGKRLKAGWDEHYLLRLLTT